MSAVAAAMTSRLGVGSAPFHIGGEAAVADTVYLTVFRREWLDRLGGYYCGTINARYLASPAVVVAVGAGAVLGFAWPVVWLVPAGYFSATTIGGLATSGGPDASRTGDAGYPSLDAPLMGLGVPQQPRAHWQRRGTGCSIITPLSKEGIPGS